LDSQSRRIRESGLEKYFNQVLIVSDKNETYFKKLVTELKIDPSQSWSIGNSIKADINPSIAAGLNAVHFAGHTWHFEHAEPIGEFHQIESLADLPRLILGRF
jgi:putative hydrolase of the HAD superfamily